MPLTKKEYHVGFVALANPTWLTKRTPHLLEIWSDDGGFRV